MDNEDELRRPPPPRPYQPHAIQLKVPVGGITATVQLLQRAGRRESGLFWYGTRDPLGNGVVERVIAPRQAMSWGNFHVPAQALTQMVSMLPEHCKLLGQIHSHPGILVEHSNYDDRMVSSKKALSIVFPRYGQLANAFPVDVGVHEWQEGYWHLLAPDAARRRVVVITGETEAADLR